MSIGLEITGTEKWLAQVAEADRRAKDMTPAMRIIAERMEQRVRNTFRTETDPWGNPWKPWKYPDEIKRRRMKEGYGLKKLFEEGTLFVSIARAFDATSVQLSMGENESEDYAEVHQFGNAHIPARPSLPLKEKDGAPVLADDWYSDAVTPLQDYLFGAFD